MDKSLAKSNLISLVHKYSENRNDILNSITKFTEEDTRREYIDVFLEIFGWDIQNHSGKSFAVKDVVTEQYINTGNKPDYSLRRNGDTILTIEAERPSKNLKNDRQPAHQVLRYGYFSNNDIGILFNMERLEIYTTFEQPAPFDKVHQNVQSPYFSVCYTDFIEKFDDIWTYLSRDSIYGYEFEQKISSIVPADATKNKLDSKFLRELDEWRIYIGQDLVNADKTYSSNIKKLNDDVQTFLNQIIFLRFAEDNSLEPSKSIEYTFDDAKKFDQHLKNLDKKYNSGIFKDSNIALLLNIDTIKKISTRLYYPEVSYDFKLIDLSILGQVYEQFLQKELTISEKNKVILKNTRAADIKSVVSTPIEVTKKIVQLALTKKLKTITKLNELLDLQIADLSVGSGVFLIAAYDLLEGHAIDIIAKETKQVARQTLVPFEFKRKMISNVFTGIDIDYHAIEVTKFSLALRLLRNESSSRTNGLYPLIPNLNTKMLAANTLISKTDLDQIATCANKKKIEKINSQIEIINPHPSPIQKFDIIIGNPPYLDTKDMKQTSSIEFEIYKSKFHSAYKQYDKYYLFIEEALSNLKSNGILVYILPHKFTKIDAGTKLREFLEKKHLVQSFIDFGDTQLFKGRSTYVAIITFSANNKYMTYQKVSSLSEIDSKPIRKIQYQDLTINNGPWILGASPKTLDLFRKLQKNKKVSDVVMITNGVQTSSKLLFIEDKDVLEASNMYIRFLDTNTLTPTEHLIERGLLRNFFKNSHHTSTAFAKVKSDRWLIFPYENGTLIPEDKLKTCYPEGYNYLLAHKNELMPKSMGGHRDVPKAKEFYQYGRTQALTTNWDQPKLIIKVLSDKPSVSYNQDGSLLASGGTAGYVPIFSKNINYDLKYVLAWLNLPIVDDMFTLISSIFEGGYWAHGTRQIKMIPILEINHTSPMEEKLYQNIIETTSILIDTPNETMRDILKAKISNLFEQLIQLKTGISI